MDSKLDVMKIKAEIANLRRIADALPPGTMKQALGKRANELGKKIGLALPHSPKERGVPRVG